MYSGSIPSSIGFKDILNTRRQALYLQIDGCAEACDEAMISKLRDEGKEDSAVVLDACAVWNAFPDPTEEPSFAAVRFVLRQALVRHFPDAVSVLNDSKLRSQAMALPAHAVRELLVADEFGTDCESTVLLLVAHWLGSRSSRVYAELLYSAVRLVHVSRPYLLYLLPTLTWPGCDSFPIMAEQYALLHGFAFGSRAERQGLGVSILSSLQLPNTGGWCGGKDSMWFARKRRYAAPEAGGSWYLTASQLRAACREAAALPRDRCLLQGAWFGPVPEGSDAAAAEATQERSLNCYSAHGLEWKVGVELSGRGGGAGAEGDGEDEVKLYLRACLPAVFPRQRPEWRGAVDLAACPLRLELSRWVGPAGRRREHREMWDCRNRALTFGAALPMALALCVPRAERAGGAEDALPQQLEPYMQDGPLRGRLAFLSAPSRGVAGMAPVRDGGVAAGEVPAGWAVLRGQAPGLPEVMPVGLGHDEEMPSDLGGEDEEEEDGDE